MADVESVDEWTNKILNCKKIKRCFKEDESRNSITMRSIDLTDMRSEISDSRRIDLDEDTENFFDYHNKVKKDPQNKIFSFYYEIQLYGQFDFIFDLKGELSKFEFMEKTEKIRSLPYHLKYTLFSNEEIKKLRQKEFAFLFFHFDELKEKGNKMYKRGKYRNAIDFYIGAYSLLKWIEFKDTGKDQSKLLREQTPILDEDIIERKCSKFNFMTNSANEEDSYRFCIVNILMSLGYAYMELRHYTSAIECFNECVTYDENLADIYFRRSQARMYDKYSDLNQLLVALADIQKCIILNESNESKIFCDHYGILFNLIENKKLKEKEKLRNFITEAFSSYVKNINNMKLILEKDFKNIYQHTQYKVLKEMKLKYKVAVKFYTETKNQEQLEYAYKEIESFTENYNNFKWYYKFNLNKINFTYGKNVFEELDLDPGVEILINSKTEFGRFLERYKLKVADCIFQGGNYNVDLVKYAIEKVIKKEKDNNNDIDINSILNDKVYNEKNNFLFNEESQSSWSLIISFSFFILSIALIFTHYYMYMKNPTKFFHGFQGRIVR